jgi:hypothetical protein
MKRFHFLIFTFLFSLCFSNLSLAQTQSESFLFTTTTSITVNTSGTFNYSRLDNSFFGRLQEGNFGPGDCVCLAGTDINLNSRFIGETSIYGGNPGLVNGVLYNQLYFSGELSLNGGTYRLPNRYTRQKFTVSRPATLTGYIRTHPTNPTSTPASTISTTEVNLPGTVTFSLRVTGLDDSTGSVKTRYKILSVKYQFATPTQ